MILLDFPEPYFKTRQEGDRPSIFDAIRQRWVSLTPEEWVRQNIIQWLLLRHGLPKAAISVEKEIRLGSMSKRFDLLIYDRETRPWMMVECKADTVELNEVTLMQILSYNLAMPVDYLMVTNGKQCHLAQINTAEPSWINTFPAYPYSF
jgi:predicted type IV restriction endonuclease